MKKKLLNVISENMEIERKQYIERVSIYYVMKEKARSINEVVRWIGKGNNPQYVKDANEFLFNSRFIIKDFSGWKLNPKFKEDVVMGGAFNLIRQLYSSDEVLVLLAKYTNHRGKIEQGAFVGFIINDLMESGKLADIMQGKEVTALIKQLTDNHRPKKRGKYIDEPLDY